MGLMDLPQELLGMICHQCHQADLTRLRLTCRTMRSIATDYLRKELKLYYTMVSMRKAENIGTSPLRAAKTIRSCWFQADRLKRHWTYASWLEGVKNDFRGCPETFFHLTGMKLQPESYNQAVLGEYYARYRTLVEEQDGLDSAGISRYLASFFKACPKLRQVRLTMQSCYRTTETVRHMPFRSATTIPFGDPQRGWEGVHTFEQLFLAAAEANARLHTLVAAGLSYRAFLMDDVEMAVVRKVMSTMRRLQFRVRRPRDAYGRMCQKDLRALLSDFTRHTPISNFLKPAIELRVLVLEMPAVHWTRGRVDLEDLVAGVHLPHLESLTLSQIQTMPEVLAAFLIAHSTTLRRLCLSALHNKGHMNWFHFFQAISGKLPKLESMKLRGGFYAHVAIYNHPAIVFSHRSNSKNSSLYEKQLSEYIKNGGPKIPGLTDDNDLDEEGLGPNSDIDDYEIPVFDRDDDTDEE